MKMNITTIRAVFVGAGKFMLAERVISVLTRCIDALIIGLIFAYPGIENLWWIFLSTTLLNLIFCALVVLVVDFIRAKYGIDLTGIEELKRYVSASDSTFKKIVNYMLSSRRTIFWIGSWFYLDPDYVTLILRDVKKSVLRDIYEITVPSVLFAMIVWVPAYWALCTAFKMGAVWAGWFIDL